MKTKTKTWSWARRSPEVVTIEALAMTRELMTCSSCPRPRPPRLRLLLVVSALHLQLLQRLLSDPRKVRHRSPLLTTYSGLTTLSALLVQGSGLGLELELDLELEQVLEKVLARAGN